MFIKRCIAFVKPVSARQERSSFVYFLLFQSFTQFAVTLYACILRYLSQKPRLLQNKNECFAYCDNPVFIVLESSAKENSFRFFNQGNVTNIRQWRDKTIIVA